MRVVSFSFSALLGSVCFIGNCNFSLRTGSVTQCRVSHLLVLNNFVPRCERGVPHTNRPCSGFGVFQFSVLLAEYFSVMTKVFFN